MKNRILNVPNTLSLLRVALVPFFLAAALYLRDFGIWGKIVPCAIFLVASLTDLLDGKIARKYGLITDFGKFIDPLADKFMVFGALVAILVTDPDILDAFVWVATVVIFRELAITSLRLVIAGKSGKVLAAAWWGKVKTCTQVAAIAVIFLEPVPAMLGWSVPVFEWRILSYALMGLMTVATVGSFVDYLLKYIPLLSEEPE